MRAGAPHRHGRGAGVLVGTAGCRDAPGRSVAETLGKAEREQEGEDKNDAGKKERGLLREEEQGELPPWAKSW